MDSKKQQWKGINQRVTPLLLPDGAYQRSEGIIFREGSAARIEGKELLVRLGEPILAILQIEQAFYLIQTTRRLLKVGLDFDTAFYAELTFTSNGDDNGVFYFLGTNYGEDSWSNPAIVITASSAINVGALSNWTDRTANDNYTQNVPNQFYIFDLGVTHHLVLNHWSYRSRSGFTSSTPTGMRLYGGNNGSSWTLIDTRTSLNFTTNDEWIDFAVVGQTVAYRFFKLAQIDPNNSGANDFFTYGELELYGTFSY